MMEIGQWVDSDLYNGRIVKIASNFICKEPVFNYSGDFPFLGDEITVPVKYGNDYRLARDIFQRILIDRTGEYSNNAKASWASLIQPYRVDPAELDLPVFMIANDNWKDKLFTGILEEAGHSESRVALTSSIFHLVETPDINVSLVEPNQHSKT